MSKFALIGVAGYIAPKHLKAIKDTGNELIACIDPHDSVGILDSYFPDAAFFTEFERFDRHLERLAREGDGVDYVSICSPNYLHDAHARFAMRIGAHAICEKPLVINPWNVMALKQISSEYQRRIYTILQMRIHPEIIKLKKEIEGMNEKFNVDLTYNAPRGQWYKYSWKYNTVKSGGMVTNIGIHLFDLLIYLFGTVNNYSVIHKTDDIASGTIDLKNANVTWQLSITGKPLRILQIDGESIDLSNCEIDLHTESYKRILRGNGFLPDTTYDAIALANHIGKTKI